MKLTLPQLRAVEAVAREGHISRAAQLLGVSQPAISNQVTGFEAVWGTKLFQRDGYAIRVTAEAGPLIGKIRLALDLLGDIEAALSGKTRDEALQLDFGFSAHRLIMPALSDYIRRCPEVRLNTRAASSLDLIDAVRRGELQLASVSSQEGTEGLFCRRLTERPLVVYGPIGHPLLQGVDVVPESLHRCPMVLWNQRSGSRRMFDALCAERGITPDARLIVDSLEVSFTTIAAGMGLGVAVEGEIAPDQALTILPLRAPSLRVGHYLVCQKGAETRAPIRDFIAIAEAALGSEETS